MLSTPCLSRGVAVTATCATPVEAMACLLRTIVYAQTIDIPPSQHPAEQHEVSVNHTKPSSSLAVAVTADASTMRRAARERSRELREGKPERLFPPQRTESSWRDSVPGRWTPMAGSVSSGGGARFFTRIQPGEIVMVNRSSIWARRTARAIVAPTATRPTPGPAEPCGNHLQGRSLIADNKQAPRTDLSSPMSD